ncbi:SMC-Scp complex subunit ScpB [Companilactobacillus halodurans]|uniref:Segregation and condensation protein B n=1 Tax=Companilactobacillus halodurans TaxID=2584183 RepID=A0A5P0ZL17_9LACO|nr:SMC-Scp complex subunit ScpB [Companilactobacillus halodurans]MQS97930.1 SMC-Scp complex subunit ScpB [Companilactobacillus halodurans]
MYQAKIMALLFVAGDQGIKEKDLAQLLEIDSAALRQNIEELKVKLLTDQDSGIQLVEYNSLYKLVTKNEFSELLTSFFKAGLGTKLSQAALEILSIVAYRQPITRVEIDEIRGVQSSGSLNTLLMRKLIKEHGKKNVPGHPNLYMVTDEFFDYFGIKSISELPKIENFEDDSNIGDINGES